MAESVRASRTGSALLATALIAAPLLACAAGGVPGLPPPETPGWVSLPLPAGGQLNLLVVRPPGPARGVVVAFPWGAGDAGLLAGLVETYWDEAAPAAGYAVVGVEIYGPGLAESAADVVPLLLEWIEENLPEAADEIVLTGASAGGVGVFHAALAMPGRVAAILAMPGPHLRGSLAGVAGRGAGPAHGRGTRSELGGRVGVHGRATPGGRREGDAGGGPGTGARPSPSRADAGSVARAGARLTALESSSGELLDGALRHERLAASASSGLVRSGRPGASAAVVFAFPVAEMPKNGCFPQRPCGKHRLRNQMNPMSSTPHRSGIHEGCDQDRCVGGRWSPPVPVAGREDDRWGNPAFSRFRALPDPFQPIGSGREGRNPFQLATQELLHGLPLPRRARGEFVAHPLRDVADGDLDWHDCVLPSLAVFRNHRRRLTLGPGLTGRRAPPPAPRRRPSARRRRRGPLRSTASRVPSLPPARCRASLRRPGCCSRRSGRTPRCR